MKNILVRLIVLLAVLSWTGISLADDNPLNLMRDDLLAYFQPLKGKIVSVNNGNVIAGIGSNGQVKKGMRFTVFREGTPFLHPVTKEPIGMLDRVVGKVEVRDVGPDTAAMSIVKGEARESDKIRVSETGIKVLFYQGKNVDWNLADSYYRVLKETQKFELLETSLDTDNDSEVIAEARKLNADIALILSAKEAGGETLLKQRLLWADNALNFSENEVKVAIAFIKELRFGEEFFGPQRADSKLYVDLPYGVRLIASGDIDGDGKAELVMSTGKDIRFYVSGGDKKSPYDIKGTAKDDHIWLDTMDINGDGRAEVIVTSLRDDTVVSRIYVLQDGKSSVLWEGNVFLRRIGNELVAQAYAPGEGYKGAVFTITLKGGYKKGSNLSLPKDVNIYDFVYLNESADRTLVLAYDDSDYLNLYDEKGGRLWRSKEDYGGLMTTFKRTSPTVMIDRGEWSVKDRLSMQSREVFVIKRIPFVGSAKGLGYSKSQIKSLWWTGVSMEEAAVVEDIPGNVLDYALTGDRLVVLDRPSFGLKLQNIFRGESPLGSVLYIYPVKGK